MDDAQKVSRFLTLNQAAQMLQVSKRTLIRLLHRKDMPGLKIGGQWRIPESQFQEWVEHRTASDAGLPQEGL